jgi:hypothetical protein
MWQWQSVLDLAFTLNHARSLSLFALPSTSAEQRFSLLPTNSNKSFCTKDCQASAPQYTALSFISKVYHFLVKVAFTEAPDCCDQLPPTQKELFLKEG